MVAAAASAIDGRERESHPQADILPPGRAPPAQLPMFEQLINNNNFCVIK
jgi:hypothetical protein